MKRIFLVFGIALATLTANAQLDVKSSGDVVVGAIPTAVATRTLDVYGDGFIRCYPANSGLWFEDYSGNPIIKPQFGNAAWLGNSNSPFWRVYSNQVWSHSFLNITSDERLKRNIQPMESSLAKLTRLNPVTYDLEVPYDGENTPEGKVAQIKDAGKNQFGLLAQEVKEIYPEAVVYDEGSENYAIRYGMLIPVLIQAVQEQQEMIRQQQEQIDALKENNQ